MARKPKSQQPRALTGDLAIQPYIRGSMYVELQKFKDSDKTRQLMLGETEGLELEASIDTSGLDLTVSEDRALHAIQVLLDKTGYKGNIPGETITSTAFKYQGLLPRLSVTYADYFEAYGLEIRGDQYYLGSQAQEAIQALKSLTTTRRMSYVRRSWPGRGRGKRAQIDVIRVTRPLITITEGFQDLTEEETAKVVEGGDLPEKRQTRLVIDISPILVDQIDTFYILKPTALHREIKQLLGGRRISRAVSLFLEWLLTKNTRTVKISKARLAERLRMDYLLEQRKPTLLETRLQEAFQVAKELEYLLDYREDLTGVLVFTLNPARCKRVASDKVEEEG